VMPTWSKRRACDMRSILQSSTCRSTPGTWPTGRSRHRSRGFRDASHLLDSRRACQRSSISRLGSDDPKASRSSHRATDEASHPHDVSPRTGRAASVGWIVVRRIQPSPQPAPNLCDRPAPAGVVSRRLRSAPRTRPGEPLAPLTHSSEGDPEPIDNSSVHHPTIASIRPSSAPPSSENHRTFRMGNPCRRTSLQASSRKVARRSSSGLGYLLRRPLGGDAGYRPPPSVTGMPWASRKSL
jgi:hypothetical protein